MKEIINFLKDLQKNNTREWFNENKQRYQQAQQKWNDFCMELIYEVGKFDPSIAKLTLRDCTYRIYRDTRFSNDKSPYKTHFGVFLCPGGKKSMHAGYYFHLGTGGSNNYPDGFMIASGNYCYEPRTIKLLHEDICYGWDEFRDNVIGKADPRFEVDMEGALKRVPREFPADAPYADWMRLKNFCLNMYVDKKFVTAPNLAQRLAEIFCTSKPFNDYINRAVDFAREEM